MSRVALVLTLLASAFSTGCYTLSGISIGENTNFYYVEQFEVKTVDGPAEIGQQFSELLKQKIDANTSLTFRDTDPDVEFLGSVSGFSVTPEAPNADNLADLNKLTLSVSIEYIDHTNEENNYTQNFSDFEVFDATVDLLSVQRDLVARIFDRISEESFNKAFSNW